MAVITISNTSSVPRAEILCINESDHKFSKNESMKEWIGSGESAESWSRLVTQVYITDKTKSQVEYLLEPLVDHQTSPPVKVSNKYYFSEPDANSPLWQEMYLTGEAHATFETVGPFIVVRE